MTTVGSMRIRAFRWTAALLGAVALGSGCAQITSFDARKEAAERWKLARAQVKARLAADQLAAGHVRDAAQEANEAIRLDPENPRLHVLRARVALAQGDAATAQALLNTVLSRREQDVDASLRAEAHYLAGVVAQQRLRWDEALVSFVRAVELDRFDVAYLVAVAQALLQSGKPHDALDTLVGREADFGFTPAYQAALAECYEQLGDWPAAAAAWRQVNADTDDAGIQSRLATTLHRAGRHAEAAGILETLVPDDAAPVAPDPQRPDAQQSALRLLLAECLLEDGQLDRARTQAGRVVRAEPRNLAAWLLLARAQAELGRHAEGLDSAERALRLDPDNRPALELAAALAFRVGNRSRAHALAQRLLALPGEEENEIARRIVVLTGSPVQPQVGLASPAGLQARDEP